MKNKDKTLDQLKELRKQLQQIVNDYCTADTPDACTGCFCHHGNDSCIQNDLNALETEIGIREGKIQKY